MYEEQKRKITSLTLMTIMLAGGMTIAMPGITPDADAEIQQQANLSVSSKYFGGPMVLEIIIDDSDYDETDERESQPEVIFDGNELVMVQSTDGKWYAYVAQSDHVAAFDGTNLNFGTPCEMEYANGMIAEANFENAIVYSNSGECRVDTDDSNNNVIREAPDTLTQEQTNVLVGQVGLSNATSYWPFIQTFDDLADDSTIKVEYTRGGSPQEITIEYDADMDDRASYEFDRSTYPHSAEVHLMISDNQLNIDPTDADVWTFATNGTATYYHIFDKSETLQGDGTPTNILPIMKTTDYDDNGFIFIDEAPNSNEPILKYVFNGERDFGDDISSKVIGIANGDPFITVEETGRNTGIFSNSHSTHESDIEITDNPDLRGLDFEFEYNDLTSNIIVDYVFGQVTMDLSSITGPWSSGEPLIVNINDGDANKNTRLDDDFDVSDSRFETIPIIQLGEPFTLTQATDVSVNGLPLVTETEEISDQKALIDNLENTQFPGLNFQRNKIYTDNGIDILNENKTKWEGFVTANSTAITSPSSNAGQVQVGINQLPGAELGVQQITEQINAVIEGLSQANRDIIAQFDTVTSDISTAKARLIELQAQGGSSLDVSPYAKILSIDTGNEVLTQNSVFRISTVTSSEFLNDFDDDDGVYQFINYDVRSLGESTLTISGTLGGEMVINRATAGLVLVESDTEFAGNLAIEIIANSDSDILANSKIFNVVFDVFTFGQETTGERHNDAIYRFEAEETTTNSGLYSGTVEYVMLNQINIFHVDTYLSLETIGDELDIIVHEDLTDEDAVEVSYYERDGQGIQTLQSAQEDAPTNSGIVSFDGDNYKVADTVTVTIEDADLNTDSDVIDIYTVVNPDNIDSTNKGESDDTGDKIALANNGQSLLFDVTFDDKPWVQCTDGRGGLASVISSLQETGTATGIFKTTFQIPTGYCPDGKLDSNGDMTSVTGLDLEVNYQDFRNDSGEEIETGDSAGVRATTGSVSFDRTVYPVPFGTPGDYSLNTEGSPDNRSVFPIHATGIKDSQTTGREDGLDTGEYIDNGDLTIHVRVNDPDYDVSASGEDQIAEPDPHGPVEISVTRGGDTIILATAGAATSSSGILSANVTSVPELGPITEIAPDAGIFELDMVIRFTDGPTSTLCPTISGVLAEERFGSNTLTKQCILQGDILQVEYTDPTDASGDTNTITDSATFDLRNGVLQSDKSVYIIGSDMILTLIEPDFDLDNDQAETYNFDLIEWDSDAATITMGNLGGGAAFDPEPDALRETGDSTGIFQIIAEMPDQLETDALERGEAIELEYTDWGPSGANFVGDEDEDVNLTIFTSNFGATVELDQKVYTWTDKVYITIVAPDHNFDGDLVDEIGNSNIDPIKVATRGHEIDQYKLVETGTDTGIFTGEVILTGFTHDADGIDGDDTNPRTDGSGPTDGFLQADDDDGLTISFEFSEDETVVGSSLIRWNIGESQWLEASYPASGTGVVRVIDPDMNLDPEAVDNFDVDVWSDSDGGGINLTVTETNEATGIFEGTVFFTVTDESSGHRLRVAEGDTVTAEYEDNTLPEPYTTADELDITATTLIGTIVPPLERAPASNLRAVDAFGNSLDTVSVDQQVQISADLANGQDREQTFAYLVQIQDGNGVTVSLAWITGSLTAGQSFSPALSWIPTDAGTYTATAFVWESVDNPTALSPPVSTTITVQ